MAPTVHSPKGYWIGVLLFRLFDPIGLTWLAWVLAPPVCWIAHWIFDIWIHFEFVHTGKRSQFEEAMRADPKERIKQIGVWPILEKGGRAKLASEPENEDLANPKPLAIFQRALMVGALDVLASIALAIWVASGDFGTPAVALLGLWGAAWAVAPDLVLATPIHQRLIRYGWFWRLDYFHHWIHTRVLAYDHRWIGLAIQIVCMLTFTWLAVNSY